MAIIKVTDFYYGAALSVLFNNSSKNISAALIESDKDRQLYDLMTDHNECCLFIKYRFAKADIKTGDYYSWQFNFTLKEQTEIQALTKENNDFVLALVCAVEGLADSELALIDKQQVKELIELDKGSITISRRKGEHFYRISVGGGRENAMRVKANRFEELFWK